MSMMGGRGCARSGMAHKIENSIAETVFITRPFVRGGRLVLCDDLTLAAQALHRTGDAM